LRHSDVDLVREAHIAQLRNHVHVHIQYQGFDQVLEGCVALGTNFGVELSALLLGQSRAFREAAEPKCFIVILMD
jgi:hypothetical protein